MDFRFSAAGGGGAAPSFGGQFAVPPFHGSQQPPQRPLYPPIPDPRSAGLTADAAREMKKAQIREEILAREAEEDRLLEQEVRRELQLERAMAERRREERQLGMFRPENRFAEPRVGDSVQRLGAPPPLNAGPYLVPYTPQPWGREQQRSVPAPPRNLERTESFGVPHCSAGERLASVHHRLESTAGEHPGSAQAPDHPEVGVSGWPPLAAHPRQPIWPPSNSDIGASKSGKDCSGKAKEKAKVKKSAKKAPPASNVVCYRCGNSGHKVTSCTSLKKKAKTRVKLVNKKRKIQALEVGYAGFSGICFKCGGSGHQQKDCVSMNEEDEPFGGFDGICFQCGGGGHRQKDCLLLHEKDAPPHPFKGRCYYCGGTHLVNDCLLFIEKIERNKNSLQMQKNSSKCYRCGGTGHLRKDCPLSDEEAQQKK